MRPPVRESLADPRFNKSPSLSGALIGLLNDFFFRPADPTILGVIRICTGLIVLYVHLIYSFDLQALCGRDAWLNLKTADMIRKERPVLAFPPDWREPAEDVAALPPRNPEQEQYFQTWGVDPRILLTKGNPVWSAWYDVSNPGWMVVLHVAFLICMFLFTIGFCTRIMAVLTWLGAISYIQRASTTLFGQDTMMNIALVYLMIAPCGAALSVDRLISRHWARRRWLAKHPHLPLEGNTFDSDRPAPRVSANFVIRLLQIHFCLIYFASGTSKLQGATWWSGSAIWFTMANTEFAPMNFAAYRWFLRLLAEQRWLFEIVTNGGVVFTLALELGFPFLIWLPEFVDLFVGPATGEARTLTPAVLGLQAWSARLRALLLTGAILMHVGIALSMGLITFSLMMLVLLLAFVPSEAVYRLLDAVTEMVSPWVKSLRARTSRPVVVEQG